MIGLLSLDRADGAAVFAGAAIDARSGVNDVRRVAGSDRVYGAGIGAGAAGNALVRNYVSHIFDLHI